MGKTPAPWKVATDRAIQLRIGRPLKRAPNLPNLTGVHLVRGKCPLWVISGHCERGSGMSASPLRADMLIIGINVR